MNGPLISAIGALIEVLDQRAGVIRPGPETVTVDPPGVEVTLTGPKGGLLTRQRQPFPKNLTLTVRGRVRIGSAVPDPPRPSDLRVVVRFPDNPALADRVEQSMPVEADGSWQVRVGLRFAPQAAVTSPLIGQATVEGTQKPVQPEEIRIENARLDWFMDTLEREEQRLRLPDRLAFVSRVRKVLLPAPVFQVALGRFKKEPPLYDKTSPTAVRWRAADRMWSQGNEVRISHVIAGIEGGQNPQPDVPAWVQQLADPRPDGPAFLQQLAGPLVERLIGHIGDIVTWGGDLGGAIQEFLYQHHYPAYYKKSRDFCKFDEYVDELMSADQLLGDIDGKNLAAGYDPARSLAANLRDYYDHHSRRRFTLYLQNQKTQDGRPTLALEPGGAVPKLTDPSREWLAETVTFIAWILLLVTLLDIGPDGKPIKLVEAMNALRAIPYPEPVQAALRPSSTEVKTVVDKYVTFLEQGLAAEK